MIAATIWCGLGLLCLIALYTRFFNSDSGPAVIHRKTILAIALLGVTGLDIVPVLLMNLASHSIYASIDWWNDQVSAWIAAALWVPHHVAALIACLTGFLILRDCARRSEPWVFAASVLLTGAIFSGAAGTSVYVTFVFAACLLTWTLVAMIRRCRREAMLIVAAGCAALIFSLPYLRELTGGGAAVSGNAAPITSPNPPVSLPIAFAVKPFSFVDAVLQLGAGPAWRANLVNLWLLPINYGFEFGFFLIVAIVQGRRLWRRKSSLTDSEICLTTVAAVSLVVCTFFRSNVIAANDLGWRGMMIAQFVFLLWGAEMLGTAISRARPLVLITLLLGLAGSLYELTMIRFFPVLADLTPAARRAHWLTPDDHLGERTFALRGFYEELRRTTPKDAIFQHNPVAVPQDNFHGLYADRQLAAETPGCGVVFGGDAALCGERVAKIRSLFDDSAQSVDDLCRKLSIDVIVAQNTDAVWKDPASWVWKQTPLVANNFARAFACSNAISPAPFQ